MSKEEYLAKLKTLYKEGGWGTQFMFDKEFEGCCPCFCGIIEVDGKDLGVAGRCWRVADNMQDLYVWGRQFGKEELEELAKPIKKALDAQKWYNEYTIIYEEFK